MSLALTSLRLALLELRCTKMLLALVDGGRGRDFPMLLCGGATNIPILYLDARE